MSDHPTPLNDDDLAKVVGGAGGMPSLQKDETMPDMNSIMKLFQDTAQEMRNAARETRGAEMSAQVESLKGAADDMRAAAEHRMQASVVAGTSQIAGGAMTLGGLGGHAMIDKSSGLHGGSQDMPGAKAMLAGVDASHAGQSATGLYQGIGSTASAAMEAKHIEASGKITEINAAAHQTSQVQAADQMQQMMDVIKDVKDKLASVQQSRIDTMKSISGKI